MKNILASLIAISIIVSTSVASPERSVYQSLKHLPVAGGDYSKVQQLLLRLVKLDTLKGIKFFKTALTRLTPADFSQQRSKLAHDAIRIVRKSDISDIQKKRVSIGIEKATISDTF